MGLLTKILKHKYYGGIYSKVSPPRSFQYHDKTPGIVELISTLSVSKPDRGLACAIVCAMQVVGRQVLKDHACVE